MRKKRLSPKQREAQLERLNKWIAENPDRAKESDRIGALKRYHERAKDPAFLKERAEIQRLRRALGKNKKYQSSDRNAKSLERLKKWGLDNAEKVKLARKGYYARHKELFAAYRRKRMLLRGDEIAEQRKLRYLRDNPGPQIRRIARELKKGRLDLASAVEQIREFVDRVNGESLNLLERAKRDGSG